MDAPVQLYRSIDPVANWQVGVAIRKAAVDGRPAGEARVEIYRWQQKTFGPRDVIKFHKMARKRREGGGGGGSSSSGRRQGRRGRQGAAALAKSHAETEWVEAYAAEDDGSDSRLAAIAQVKGEPWLFSTVQEDTAAEDAGAAPPLQAADLPGPAAAAELRRGGEALRSGARSQVMVLKCAVGLDEAAFADGRIPRGSCEEQVLCVARAMPHSNLLQMQPGFAHARVNADAAEGAQDAFGSAGLTSLDQIFSRYSPREFRVRCRKPPTEAAAGPAGQRQRSDPPAGAGSDGTQPARSSKQFDTFEYVVFDPNEVGLGVLEEGVPDADTALAQAAAKLRAVDEQALAELEARRGVGAEVHLPPAGEAWCSCSVEVAAVEGCEAESLLLHYEVVNHAGSGWHVSQPDTPLHEATEAGAVRSGGAVGDFLRTHVEGVTQTAAGRWGRPLQATEEAAIATFTTPAGPKAKVPSKWSADTSWRLAGKQPWQESAVVHHVNCCFDCDMVHRTPAHEAESELGRALRPPRLLLTAVHVDSWDRTSVVGYAWADLPTTAGSRSVEVLLSRPQASVSEEVAGFFLGGAGRLLRHPGTTATGNRFGLQWEAAGVVHVRFDTSFQLPVGSAAEDRSQMGSPTLSAAEGSRSGGPGALTMPRAAAPALGSATSPAGTMRATGRGPALSLRTTAEVLAASRALRDRAQAFLRPQPAAPPRAPTDGDGGGGGGGGPPQVQAVDDMRAGGGD